MEALVVLASKARRPTGRPRHLARWAPNANANERELLGARRWWKKKRDEGGMQTSTLVKSKGRPLQAARASCWTERSCLAVRAL